MVDYLRQPGIKVLLRFPTKSFELGVIDGVTNILAMPGLGKVRVVVDIVAIGIETVKNFVNYR